MKVPNEASIIDQLLSRVPDEPRWQDLAADLQAEFMARAQTLLVSDRQSCGMSGLQQKEALLASGATPAMNENIDRIFSVTYASELPGGFKMSRDVVNADLKRLLVRIYLAITDDRGLMLNNFPGFMGWDGMPVKELPLTDHEHVKTMALWQRQTEDGLHQIPESALTPLERALRAKSYVLTRAGKYFDKPAVAVNGSIGFSSLYSLPVERRSFADDSALLDAYNASMFTEFREVNVSTLDAFVYDYETEFNAAWLKKQGMSDALANNVLKLAKLYRARVQELPEKGKRCTIFSPSERNAYWDSFTGRQISNADGSETMQSYARLYQNVAAQRLVAMRVLARASLERLFPDGSPELSPAQRTQVLERLLRETRPAAMMDTRWLPRLMKSRVNGQLRRRSRNG